MGAALVAAQLAVATNDVDVNNAQSIDSRSPRTPPHTEPLSSSIDPESILLAYSAERGKFEQDDPTPAFVPSFPERPLIPFHTSWFKTSL
ncbi:hypothetical protein AAVH_04599 [Aphelenchoides avenae]|nr:hypothetical protein AAVH_04599 [Aphelenchus avenae]